MGKVECLLKKKLKFRGFINSISQTIPTLFYGISVFYGGILVANHDINYKTVIRFEKNDSVSFDK